MVAAESHVGRLLNDQDEMSDLGYTERMGQMLCAEVERQLLHDLRYYDVNVESLSVDWAGTCREGHATRYLDGELENWSGISVLGANKQIVAEGWMEFIHGGGNNPLFVFWEFLEIFENGVKRKAKPKPGIPSHVWQKIPEESKALCAKSDSYDAAWSDDPLVSQWRRNRAS